jgi:hypothetical protein
MRIADVNVAPICAATEPPRVECVPQDVIAMASHELLTPITVLRIKLR